MARPKASDYADTLRAEIEQRQNRVREIEITLAGEKEALQALRSVLARSEDQPDPTAKRRAPKSSVKTAVLKLLDEVGTEGLNAAIAVDIAKERHQIDLDRGSVSSLLSRLKHDGVVTYDNSLYRLKEHSKPAAPAIPTANNIHQHPASGRSVIG